jgi:phosphoribosylaminoimidazole-succinocarboxamide synthase
VECIARGYLTGLGLKEYQRLGTVSGVGLPRGLVEGSKLPEPIFTPTTKAPAGQHDDFMTYDEVIGLVGGDLAGRLRAATLDLYRRGARIAAAKGVLLADTKFEFGRAADGTLTLGDEVLTSDSSRYWPADEWEPGRPQRSFDKQVVRDWSTSTGWDKTDPGPEVPDEVVELTRSRYVDLYQRLTGEKWS